jgi:hypothetical protein
MLWTIDGAFDLNLMFNGRQFALISHLIKLCEAAWCVSSVIAAAEVVLGLLLKSEST